MDIQTNFSWNPPILRYLEFLKTTHGVHNGIFLSSFYSYSTRLALPADPADGLKMEAVREAAKFLTSLRIASFLDKISAAFWTAIATASQIARITGNS